MDRCRDVVVFAALSWRPAIVVIVGIPTGLSLARIAVVVHDEICVLSFVLSAIVMLCDDFLSSPPRLVTSQVGVAS